MTATGTDGISTEAWQVTKPRGSKDFNQAMAANLRNDAIANRLEEVKFQYRKRRFNSICKLSLGNLIFTC